MKNEISGLMERNSFDISNLKSLRENSNLLDGLFLMAIKTFGAEAEVMKARCIVQEQREGDFGSQLPYHQVPVSVPS